MDAALDVLFSSGAPIVLLHGGSNRERFAVRFAVELSSNDTVELSDHLGCPSVAFKVNGRWRVAIFAPHPCAAYGRTRDAKNADEEFEAYRGLLKARMADCRKRAIRDYQGNTPSALERPGRD
ncbi:hypothetical protein OC842_004815 [Tilletia horrida]|uniref:Uncharacterized protein n=1 Tax=Tilletia horrida TaxID=155126 RepID=A0AAN6G912_9BASI|nr:hypothetical protein OC842_004815 [Tilletia horrida]